MRLIICQICLLLSFIFTYYLTAEITGIVYEIYIHLVVVCKVLESKNSGCQTEENAAVRLQKFK